MTLRYALCLLLTWLPAAVFAQTITSISPSSGNVGTLVTLSGTGLNLVTAVDVNGVPGVVLSKTSTALRLLVMPGTTSGPITATGGATATSTANFTVTRTALNTAQQGSKLVGTGATGTTPRQGYAVALSADGNTLAVGGDLDNDNNTATNAIGATWVFVRNGTVWSQQGPKLVGTGVTGPFAHQGTSVALSADGNTLAVGGNYDNSARGATWVFARSGTAWSQQGSKLVGTGTVTTPGNTFIYQGTSVALSADGNTLAVGGHQDNSGRIGATWVFARNGTAWSQQGPKLVGTGAVDGGFPVYQGHAVALSADGMTLAVGGYGDNSARGATWVFARSGTAWSQQGPKLVGTGGTLQQGFSVALSADGMTLAVGGYNNSSSGTIGATWVFARSGTAWSQQGPALVGTGVAGPSAQQGTAVALSADGNTLAVGGPSDNSSVGATWVFARSGTAWSQQGPKLVGTGVAGPYAYQGYAVALSADGTTLAVGGFRDDSDLRGTGNANAIGATWVFSTANSPLAQRFATGPRASASFFPNPVAEQITLTGGASAGTLRLFDGTGRTVFTQPYQQGHPFDLSTLTPGLYWLQLNQEAVQPLLKR